MVYALCALGIFAFGMLCLAMYYCKRYEQQKVETDWQYERYQVLQAASKTGLALNDKLNELLARVDSFSDLDWGWDGYDAPPIQTVQRLIAYDMINVPTVMPLQDGRIEFRWCFDAYDVRVCIAADGTLTGTATAITVKPHAG